MYGAASFGLRVDLTPTRQLLYPLGAEPVQQPSILALLDPSMVLIEFLSFSTSGRVKYILRRTLESGLDRSMGCSTVEMSTSNFSKAVVVMFS